MKIKSGVTALMFLLIIGCTETKNSTNKEDTEKSHAFFEQAKTYFDKQDFETAVTMLDSALVYETNYVSAIATRASALFNLGKYDMALKEYNRAIELFPQDEINRPGLASLYLERGDTHYTLEDFEHAIADFDKSIELNPENAIAYVYRGDARDNAGLINEAIADYTKAIELNPNYADAYYNRGVTNKNSEKKDAACADFKKAAELGSEEAKTQLSDCK